MTLNGATCNVRKGLEPLMPAQASHLYRELTGLPLPRKHFLMSRAQVASSKERRAEGAGTTPAPEIPGTVPRIRTGSFPLHLLNPSLHSSIIVTLGAFSPLPDLYH